MENSRTCENYNVNVHRASFVKHLRSKKQLENEKQSEINLPEWLFKEKQAPIKKVYNPKTLKEIARQIKKLNDKKLDKELA